MSLLLFWISLAVAAPQQSFEAGIDALRTGDTRQAVRQLTDAVEQDGLDPAVYHALGNALYREDHLGLAIAAWRRGLMLDPGAGDLAANLDQARKQLKDRLDPPAPDLGPFFWQAALSTRASGLAASSFAALALWLALAGAWRKRQGRPPQPGLWRLALALGAFSALLTASTLTALQQPSGAIVLSQVSGRSALGPGGVELFVLHEGTEVTLVEHAEADVLVRLSDDRQAWVPSAALLSTDPTAPFTVP